jgi:hypothetical protein
MREPSGENATDVTPPVWPSRGSPTAAPVSASQMRTVLSSDPETMREPSGENATDLTRLVWSVIWSAVLGQVGVVVDTTLVVFWNICLYCLAMIELCGTNGSTDKYKWGVLCAITVEAKFRNPMSSFDKLLSSGS